MISGMIRDACFVRPVGLVSASFILVSASFFQLISDAEIAFSFQRYSADAYVFVMCTMYRHSCHQVGVDLP